MTRREAIEALEYLISGECTDTQMDYVDEIEMAIVDMKICEANNAGWISVKDRLPENEQKALIWTKYGVMAYAEYLDDEPHRPWLVFHKGNCACRTRDNVVTHWMPLPEPPKEDE